MANNQFGNFEKNTLLVSFDQTLGGLKDWSKSVLTATTGAGGVSWNSTIKKFYGTSGYFAGNTRIDYGSVPFNFGTEDFTVEFWVNVVSPSSSTWPLIFQNRSVYTIANNLYCNVYGNGTGWTGSASLNFTSTSNTGFSGMSTTSIIRGTGWHHIALSRSELKNRLFVDGIKEAESSYTTSTFTGDRSLIGCQYNSSGDSYNYEKMYLSDFRVTKGLGRYTENFTPKPLFQLITGRVDMTVDKPITSVVVTENQGYSIASYSRNEISSVAIPDAQGYWSTRFPRGLDFDISYYCPTMRPRLDGPYNYAEYDTE